ncbi:MAG: outer membrane beta-barrel protein [Cyclobacteriaceae bacterium]|nr:outer membrane beta-barrel protein [Cyclobacteriaceae bacterium]
MKKLIFTIVILITSIFAKAQVSQGSILLGGSFQISTSSDGNGPNAEKDKTTELRISPSAGYFLADNIAVGLNAGFFSQNIEAGQNDNESTTTSFNFGPFARYYMPTSGDKFYFMAETGLWFGSARTKNTNPTNTTENKRNSISIYISRIFLFL